RSATAATEDELLERKARSLTFVRDDQTAHSNSGTTLADPAQVISRTFGYIQLNDFGDIVRMQLAQSFRKFAEPCCGQFENRKYFRALLDLIFPEIDRLHRRNNISARDQD